MSVEHMQRVLNIFGQAVENAQVVLKSGIATSFSEREKTPWEDMGNSIPGEGSCGNTYRMKVPGGWLVRVETVFQDPYTQGFTNRSVQTVFVADTGVRHEW